jgi:hypothetical protein
LSDVIDDYSGTPRYSLGLAFSPLFLSEYGFLDKVNHLRGLYETFQTVYPQLQNVDLLTQSTQLDVPVYFIVGRQDMDIDPSAVERYYNALEAPRKELIWYESTGQGMDAESSWQVADVLVQKVLPETLCEHDPELSK